MHRSARSPLPNWLTPLNAVGLLLIVCGLPWHWWETHRTAIEAADAYEHAVVRFHNRLASAMDLCDASEALCQAEQAVPFADVIAAQSGYVERLHKIERMLHSTTLKWDGGEPDENEARMLRYVEMKRRWAENRLCELQSP